MIFPISFKPKVAIRTKVRNLKLKVPLVKKNVLCRCQLVSRTSKSAGARGYVQNFGGCQAPVLTQALAIAKFVWKMQMEEWVGRRG